MFPKPPPEEHARSPAVASAVTVAFTVTVYWSVSPALSAPSVTTVMSVLPFHFGFSVSSEGPSTLAELTVMPEPNANVSVRVYRVGVALGALRTAMW